MDHLVENDTHDIHWVLQKAQSHSFIRAFFSDERIFNKDAFTTKNDAPTPSVSSFLEHFKGTLKLPLASLNQVRPTVTESDMSKSFNDIIRHTIEWIGPDNVNSDYKTREWTGDAANKGLAGCDAVRKPDLILCRQPPTPTKKIDMRVDVLSIGEMKHSIDRDELKESFIELAGKAALLYDPQDGRYATTCIRVLSNHVIFTLFDRGGSISTEPIYMGSFLELFLRILLGITFAERFTLGFDPTVRDLKDRTKDVDVTLVSGEKGTINVNELLFISGVIHGRGTLVWGGTLGVELVVVKDCFIDPMRRYTEGTIIRMLNDAKVDGVPQLILEQMDRTQHPIGRQPITNSTHVFRAPVPDCPENPLYQLCVRSRSMTKPRGYPIFEFSSLAELLIGFMDSITIHRDPVKLARILHRDISLCNLFLVLGTDKDGHLIEDLLQNLSKEQSERPGTIDALQNMINEWSPRRGFLADWGYVVPIPDGAVSIPDDSVPVKRASSENTTVNDTVIPVANDSLPEISYDADGKRYRMGTWPWMAAELSFMGSRKLVDHTPEHDLESFFYVLLGVCLLFDEPRSVESEELLAFCFDVFEPTLSQKIIFVQSEIGWGGMILPNISAYFQPIVPLLELVRKEFILSIEMCNSKFQSNPNFTHASFLTAIADTLATLPATCWEVWTDPPPKSGIPQKSGDAPSTESTTVPLPTYSPHQVPTASSSSSTIPPSLLTPTPPHRPLFPPQYRQQFSRRLHWIPLKPSPRSNPPPESDESLPRPKKIRRLGVSSGSASRSKGADPLSRRLKMSSGSSSSKRVANDSPAGPRPAKKRAKMMFGRPNDQPNGDQWEF